LQALISQSGKVPIHFVDAAAGSEGYCRFNHNLLPGFVWVSWTGFVLGLIETYGYGWYAALIWVPLYNVFALRDND
jgi:hypothetical protein